MHSIAEKECQVNRARSAPISTVRKPAETASPPSLDTKVNKSTSAYCPPGELVLPSPARRAETPLGIIANFVALSSPDLEEDKKKGAKRWARLRYSAARLFTLRRKGELARVGEGLELLPPTTDLGYHRVCFCNWSVVGRWSFVDGDRVKLGDDVAVSYSERAKRSTFKGLFTCGSWPACPGCGARIAERRRVELARLLVVARERECVPALVVFTQHHKAGELISDLVARLDGDLRAMQQSPAYKRIVKRYGVVVGDRRRLFGVTGPETTWGYNGYHYHKNGVYILAPGSDPVAFENELRDLWYTRRGGSFSPDRSTGELLPLDPDAWLRGCKVSSKEGDLAEYVSKFGRLPKWDISEELALSSRKRGRGGRSSHYTMMQLLELYSETGDRRAGEVWLDWAVAMKGKPSLRFSPGLHAWAGMVAVTDEEIAEDTTDYLVDLAYIGKGTWNLIRGAGDGEGDLRSVLLSVADSGDPIAVRAWLAALVVRGSPGASEGVIEGCDYG